MTRITKHFFCHRKLLSSRKHMEANRISLEDLNPVLLPDLFNLTDVEVMVPVDLALTALSFICVINRCARG